MVADPTERDYLEDSIREQTRAPQSGTVERVYAHTDPDDNSNHECDVRIAGEETVRQRLPVAVPTDGSARPPRGPSHPEGPDDVIVQYLDGEAERGVVTHVLPTVESRAPLAEPGDVRLTRGQLALEIDGDGNRVRVARRADGNSPATASITLSESGDVTIETDGDVVVTGGSIRIGGPGAESVAIQNHTHDFTDADGTTKTTDPPSESGTNTRVE